MKKLFIAVLILLFAASASAQQDLVKVRIDKFEGGMVSNSIPDFLQPNQAASMVNVVLDVPGRLSKRKGQDIFLKDVSNDAFKGIGRFDPDATTSYLVAASGTNVIRAASSSADWTIANIASQQTVGLDTEFVQANNLLFAFNGYDKTAWYSGSAWAASFNYPASPPTATTGAWLRNYLFLAGATIHNDWVYFSNNLDPAVFSAIDVIPINTGDGQKVQRLMPFRMDELIIYKERSVFVLDISGSTPLSSWTVQPISTTVGAIAPKSVVNLGNDQWFLSSEPIALRSLARTQYDKILVDYVSGPIQDIFNRTGIYKINLTNASKSAAIIFNNKFFLAFPEGDSTVNNMVTVYDFTSESWSLIKGWYPADWEVFDNRLFYADANDGRVIECFTGTMGDVPKGPGYFDAASDPSVGIEYVYQTKTIDFDNVENFKQPDALELEFDATGDYDIDVYINLDFEGWQKLGTVNVAGNSVILPVTLPTVLGNGGLARETFQLQSYGEFKKMQVMVVSEASMETVTLQRVSAFARVSPWRRE